MHRVLIFCLLVVMSSCGRFDAYTAFAPDYLKLPQPEQPPPDPEPEVARLFRDGINSVVLENAKPRNVRVSRARRDPSGSGWTVCFKATVTSVGGSARGLTYLVPIDRGEIGIRRLAEPRDGCESETYTRL